ncbi:MAG TPA: hypothetical protein VJB59_06335 [Bdellovibrionota bacterium]|nr:hypothetical protein [Bdellovibrionota bacterium]
MLQRLDRAGDLALLDPENTDINRATAGTWQLDSRYMNNCNSENTGILEKLVIRCDATGGPDAQLFREYKSTDELIREGFLHKNSGWTFCFNYSAERVITPVGKLTFQSIEHCQKAILELRSNYRNQPYNPGFRVGHIFKYFWGVVFSKETRKILTKDEIGSGNF